MTEIMNLEMSNGQLVKNKFIIADKFKMLESIECGLNDQKSSGVGEVCLLYTTYTVRTTGDSTGTRGPSQWPGSIGSRIGREAPPT